MAASPLSSARARGDGGRRGDLAAWDFGCETWLFWNGPVGDVDPQHSIRCEVRVNGVVDGAGNRSPTSSVTLTNQTC